MTVPAFSLTVGPVLTYWSRATLTQFYADVAASPAHTVCLGEVVCSRRHEMKLDDWLALAADLNSAGKEVVLSAQALIESEAELRTLRRIADQGEYLVEANDAAALHLLAGHARFVIGPHVNVYSRLALDELAALGAQRWVPPVELSVEAIGEINATPFAPTRQVDTEVFAFGRLPLAMSARCFTARHYGLNRDECQFRCLDHPDGITLRTQEGEAFLALNGLQTQSARVQCLLGWRDAIAAAGITRLRLSPTARDFVPVIDSFHRVFNLSRDVAGAELASNVANELAALARLDLPGELADGYARGAAGHAWQAA
jgi:collagenase-like PrtC family protease